MTLGKPGLWCFLFCRSKKNNAYYASINITFFSEHHLLRSGRAFRRSDSNSIGSSSSLLGRDAGPPPLCQKALPPASKALGASDPKQICLGTLQLEERMKTGIRLLALRAGESAVPPAGVPPPPPME